MGGGGGVGVGVQRDWEREGEARGCEIVCVWVREWGGACTCVYGEGGEGGRG